MTHFSGLPLRCAALGVLASVLVAVAPTADARPRGGGGSPPSPGVVTGASHSFDGAYSVFVSSDQSGQHQLQERLEGTSSWTTYSLGASGEKVFSGKADGVYEYRGRVCDGSTGCGAYGTIKTVEVEELANVAAALSIASAGDVGSLPLPWAVSRTGSLTTRIPIQVPPGVNGQHPTLALSYSSGARQRASNLFQTEGVLGYGWSLSGFSEIQRCRVGTSGGLQFDTTDALCLDGERLVLESGSHWSAGAEYRTESNGYVRVTLHSNTGGLYFVV